MNDDNRISEAKFLLNEIHLNGLNIKVAIKDILSKPVIAPLSSKDRAQILINPNIFYYQLFESFWTVFKFVSENIENPLVLPWIRIIMEQCSNIIIFSQQNEEKKKQIACKWWICNIGLSKNSGADLKYDDFIDYLAAEEDKQDFLEFKEKDYPAKEFHKKLKNLFPPVSEDNLPKFIEDYIINLKGNSINKAQFGLLYRDMSLYHHPSIMINNLEREVRDKSHIFRCFSLISICGFCLIKFAVEEIIIKQEKSTLEDLSKRINELVEKLFRGSLN